MKESTDFPGFSNKQKRIIRKGIIFADKCKRRRQFSIKSEKNDFKRGGGIAGHNLVMLISLQPTASESWFSTAVIDSLLQPSQAAFTADDNT